MRAIVNSTNDIYFLLSPEWKLLNINRAGQKNLTDFWDRRASDDYEAALKKAFQGHPESYSDFKRALKGETVELEIELVRLDGEKIWHRVRHLPAYNDQQEIIGVSIVLNDIHSRKLQELKLRESETMYRAILNSTNDAYLFLSPKKKLLRVNQLGLHLLEQHWNAKTYEEIEARIEELYTIQPGAREAIDRALGGEVVEFEVEVIRPDKTGVWYLIRNLPAYDDEHNIIGVSMVLTNIHERKTQEILLEESRSHYRAILNSTSDVYFLVSPELKLLVTNATGEDSLARMVNTLSLPDKQAAFEHVFKLQESSDEYFRRALSGEVIEVEVEVNRTDGTKVWYYQRYLPVLDHAKDTIGVSISMSNIHTRKMQELEIDAKNQALTKIAWSQSHEMRRPVASILGLIQLRQTEDPMITESEFMKHLATMVNELDQFIRKNVEHTYEASRGD
jgi:PAS domain S-box-containing protein